MTVEHLLRCLKGLDPHVEVRMAHQPHWPFEYDISEVVVTEGPQLEIQEYDGHWHVVDANEDPGDEDYWLEDCGPSKIDAQMRLETWPEHTPVVFLGEGSQLGYLPGDARKALGW